MAIILTRYATTSSGASGAGVYTQEEKLALELYMAFRASQLSHYVEYTYTDGDLSNITIYEDDTKVLTLFAKNFSYDVDGNLSQILLTRTADSAQLLKTFAYTDGDLTSVEVSAGP